MTAFSKTIELPRFFLLSPLKRERIFGERFEFFNPAYGEKGERV
jgi:hypothetical protein